MSCGEDQRVPAKKNEEKRIELDLITALKTVLSFTTGSENSVVHLTAPDAHSETKLVAERLNTR